MTRSRSRGRRLCLCSLTSGRRYGNHCSGTKNNVARIAANQQQPIEWEVTKTRDNTTKHVIAQLVGKVGDLLKQNKKKRKKQEMKL